ncbi:MAG: type II toxin-antitoxin system VapC family toxin [Gemmatimonadales bacterium]|nr:type II toxin-antitoxin system VapC family toxin [Gemmatimonadales bacterium]
MRLLLDTHIWLRALLESERLSAEVRAALESPDNELWLSSVSVWEASILAELGRLSPATSTSDWLQQMVAAIPRREAPLTREIAMMSRQLSLPHQDPADRFLAATARVHDLTLVTADERLQHSDEFAVLANR